MSENIESRLISLRTRRDEANRRRSVAEAKLDEVAARKQQIEKALADQGFDNPEDARAEVQRITAEVDAVLDEITEKVSGL